MSITTNLPSTSIASAAPATNFSGATYTMIYVGSVIGNSIGLLSIPSLPGGAPWSSVVLQFGVLTLSGTGPSTIKVQKVTAPAPLDVTTVTYNTAGLTIDPTVQATKSVSAADTGSAIQIDLTSLMNSWYSVPFSGLALTCTDGSYAVLDSMNSEDASKRPVLIFTDGTKPPVDVKPVDVKIAARLVETQTESVTAPTGTTSWLSTPRDYSQKTQISFFVTNTGTVSAGVGIEESADGTNYIAHPEKNIQAGGTAVFTPFYYAKFARLYFHSVDPNVMTSLTITYIAQT